MTTTTDLIEARATDLSKIREMLEAQRVLRYDYVASSTALGALGGKLTLATGEVDLGPDGVTQVSGVYDVGDVFNEGFAVRFGLPAHYLRKWNTEREDIWDQVINRTLHGGERHEGAPYPADDRKHFVRLLRPADDSGPGFARAILSSRYAPIESLDALIAVMRGAAAAGITVRPEVCDLTERKCMVNLVAPEIEALAPTLLGGYHSQFKGKDARLKAGEAGQPEWVSRTAGWTLSSALAAAEREGQALDQIPVLTAGLRFTNSEVGRGRRTLVPYMLAQVCGNRLVLDLEADTKVHLGSDQSEGAVEWSQATIDAELDLITEQTADLVRMYLSQEYLEEQVARVEALAGARVREPEKTVKEIAVKVGFTKGEADAIFGMFVEGAQPTSGGLANAITAWAQTLDSADRADYAERRALPAMELAAA